MASKSECSPNLIMELTHAVEKTEMIYNACELGIFDALEDSPGGSTAHQVASKLELKPESEDSFERLLVICVNLGMLTKTHRDGQPALYENTPTSSLYLTSASDLNLLTLVSAARHQFDLAEFLRANKRDDSRCWFFNVEENDKAFREMHFRFRRYYYKQDGYSRTSVHLLKTFDLSQYKTVVDLGGALGTLCRAHKTYYPDADVTCLDMPRVIEFAQTEDEAKSRPKVINYHAADLFGDEPLPKADLYIVGHLIHMFKDDICNKVLKKVRSSINKGGAMLMLEKVLSADRSGPELGLMYDIRMNMSANAGLERTLDEFKELLARADFPSARVQHYANEGYNIYDAILCPLD